MPKPLARPGLEHMVAVSPAMTRVVEQIRHLAPTRSTVLIHGEPGTGRSLVAHAIHLASPRREAPFIEVASAAMPERLLADELLGVEGEGAGRPGLLERAHGGSLFVHRIDEMPTSIQVHLLQALADREVVRQGSTERRRVELRVMASTSSDLEDAVLAGRFRSDLFQRLSAVVVHLPPLRDRVQDIPLLAEAFLRDLNREHHRRVSGLTRGVLERLMRHDWPGNVAELHATLEGMMVFARGKRSLDLSDLPPEWKASEGGRAALQIEVGMTLDEVERRLIEATLRETAYDKPRTASLLGIGLRTLYRKIQRYRLS
jgi:transcriptional regulator with PAS, ATPase and Fis domain